MADEQVSMSIGPPGEPATTEYTYALGQVALSARPATNRTLAELDGIITRIELFITVVASTTTPPPPRTLPGEPFVDRLTDDNPGGVRFLGKFRSGQLVAECSYTYATKLVHFEPRNAATVAWSDFIRFVAWLRRIGLAARG